MAGSPSLRLPALVLAWTLALLITPALASAACSGAATDTYSGSGDWTVAAHWSAGLPGFATHVCIKAGSSVTVTTSETISDFDVEAGASLSIATGGALTTFSGSGSTTQGTLSVDNGSLSLDTNLIADAGSLVLQNSASLSIGTGRQLTLGKGMDVSVPAGTASLINNGVLAVSGSTGIDPTTIGAKLLGDGTYTNDGPVTLTGGANGAGTWKLGSGAGLDEPVVNFASGTYVLDGQLTDADSGGLGHIVVGSATLQQSQPTSQIKVFRFDVNDPAATVDVSTGTAGVQVSSLTVSAGLFEDDSALTAQQITERDGELADNAAWTTTVFHWGGGKLSAAAAHGGTLTAATLDMTQDGPAGDTGVRQTLGADLVATGPGTQDGPYAAGSFDLAGGSNFMIGSGATWQIGADVDVAQSSGTGKIIVHGTLDKHVDGGTQSTIAPQLDVPDGTVAVTQGTLVLSLAPVQYDAGVHTLTAGTWSLSGTLRLPGSIVTLSTGVRFNGQNAHLQDSTSGNADALTTLSSNAAGNTIALSGNVQLAPVGTDFQNNGTVTLSGTASVVVAAGKSYIQAANGAVTNLTTAGSSLTAGNLILTNGKLGGIGTVTAAVANSGGTVSPGNSPGTLTITGSYAQSGVGLLNEEIDGPAPSQYDRLIVTGTASLGGTLLIGSTNGYQPAAGLPFDMISAGAVTGAFSAIAEPPVGIASYFDPSYGATTMRLTSNSVAVGDVTVSEGNSGTTNAVFTISLGQAAPATASVDWATQDGSAVAGSDYTAASGTVTFAPGETTKTVTVAVTGDTTKEPDETFGLNLSNPVGTRVARANAVGTIVNDDSPQASAAQVPPGDIDGFAVAPPPVQGKSVNVAPVSGTVLVKLPGSSKFVKLPDEERVPTGTIVDATHGVVRLFSVGSNGRLQSALFYEGVFRVTQAPGQALTTLTLVGGSFAGCPNPRAARASAKRKRPGTSVRHLWGNGKGQFRTAGRFATATIRGTRWLTDDRCNGTLIRVAAGAVTVRDLTVKRSLVLKAPRSYLAPAKR